MGLLDGVTQQGYNDAIDNKGDYQFVTLDNIIETFMGVYVGESKILNRVNRSDVQFHAMRALQELSYDVLRSKKAYEIEVPPNLTMYLPQDYVNYCKVVRVDSNGIEMPLYPTGRTSNPFPIAQNADGTYQFTTSSTTTTTNGTNTVSDSSESADYSLPQRGGAADAAAANQDEAEFLKLDSSNPTSTSPYTSDTWDNFNSIPNSSQNNQDSDEVDYPRFDNRGRRYGLDPQHAQTNGTFYIDVATGFIHFSSNLSGEKIILKYISDGLGTDEEMIVHKFAEEAMYKHIMYGVLSGRSGVPEYIVQRFKKEKFAETRKAKIRLSNIKMEEFTQVLKGLSKPIK